MNWNEGAYQFTDALASSAPTPGGGAAAAMAGAMGCALLMMSVATTLKRKATPPQHRPLLKKILRSLQPLHTQLKTAMVQDAQAYEAYLAAAKLPKDDPSRPQAVQESLRNAAQVPADTARTCQRVQALLAKARPVVADIILSDVACAQHLLNSAIQCCVENICANQKYSTPQERQEKYEKWLKTFSQGN